MAEEPEARFENLDLILIESGGDNLASTFLLDLVDYGIFVIDVAGGDDTLCRRGPGVLSSYLLVVNKYDLAPYVVVHLPRMRRESAEAPAAGPCCSPTARRVMGSTR